MPPPQGRAVPSKTASIAYAEGIAKLAAGDLDAAQKAFQKALDADQGYVHAMLGLAEVAFQLKRGEEGGRWLSQALMRAPEDAHVQASYGRWQATLGHNVEAEQALKHAIALDARLIRPRMDLADLYATALRKPKEAIALYRQVIELEPTHAGAHYALGVTQMHLGALSQARPALEEAARLAPDNPLPALALATLHARLNNTKAALQWVERALKIQPGFAEALELRGDLRQAIGQRPAAMADYRAALRAQPQRASAWLKLGMMQQAAGDTQAASKSYREVIKHNPNTAVAYNNLAWLELQQGGDLIQAEVFARKAVELAPHSAEFLDTLGWVLRARGQRNEAEQILSRAAASSGASADVHYHLGIVYSELGRMKEARDALERALRLDPRHSQALAALQRIETRR